MSLNDEATDTDRQRLLPFVTRLACADSDEIELERAQFIARQTGRKAISFERGLQILS